MKMHEKKLRKLGIYAKIANVLFILTLVFGALFVLAASGAAAYLASIDFEVTGMANAILTEIAPEIGLSLPSVVIPYQLVIMIILYIVIGIALTAYIIKAVANMFKNISESQTPFTEHTVKILKSIAYALFIYAGIVFIMSILMGSVVPHPAGANMNITIKGTVIFFGVLMLALSEIFDFGMSLQQDSESIV